MKYTAAQKRLLEDQGDQFKFGTHPTGRTKKSRGPNKRFKGKKIESEDFHGGDLQSGGQFPTDALERSQARKGTPDLFKHPDDPGQAGKK